MTYRPATHQRAHPSGTSTSYHASGRLIPCMAVLVCFVFSGCGFAEPSRQYGDVRYPGKSSSINGLGIFEELCNQAGSRCFVTNRLSPRLDKADAIVLVGNTFEPPAKEARDWLEEWLAAKAGRSVIYFGRDFDAEIYYRQQTLARVPAAERYRAALKLAGAQMKLNTLLMSEISSDVFCRWFQLKIHKPQVETRNFTGPWADDLEPSQLNSRDATWPVRVVLDPVRRSQRRDKPKWLAPATGSTIRVPTFDVDSTDAEDAPVFRSIWSEYDINDDQTWKEEWSKVPENVSVLLAGGDGTPLVMKLTSSRYADSQILTLVNAAPLLNGSLVRPHFREVARRLIDSIQPAKRIALLPFNQQGILVSDLEDEDEIAGLSVLTVWPMNIVVAHLAFLGILICLALFPILGRPQGLRRLSLSDFGQHAEAVGRMLQRTGDSSYATRIIAEYFRTVRGEAPPPWLKSALPQPAAKQDQAGVPNSHSDSSA